ncbi:MAG: GNAT family N-acetyltransferase [Oscillochloridaceae bacterium umkhey_bin13]
MELTLRLFDYSPADYVTMAAIHNAIWPEHADTPDDLQHWDTQKPAEHLRERWIAEHDGVAVGLGQFFHATTMYHPQRFYVYVQVPPAYQGRGIGTRLYDLICARLAPHQPQVLRTDTREDQTATLRFIARHGFVEEMRNWESRLDVASFDPTPWAKYAAQAAAHGITIKSLAELLPDGETFKRQHYEAQTAMVADVPFPDTFTPLPYEQWAEQVYNDPTLLPEGYFIAMHKGMIAGTSALWRHSSDPTVLHTGLTATMRDFRRMGVATALKLRAVAYAKAQGIREIRTYNESNNRAMLNINEAFGFVKQPAWIAFAKHLV